MFIPRSDIQEFNSKPVKRGVLRFLALVFLLFILIHIARANSESTSAKRTNILPEYATDAFGTKTVNPRAAGFDSLRGRLDSLRQAHNVSGLAVSIVGSDSTIWSAGFGWADRQKKIEVTPNTLFRVGSITKSFISLGIMRLVEEGEIELQTPVLEIAPELPVHNPWAETHPVRVVHLLEHTAGFDDLRWHELFNKKGPADVGPLKGLTARAEYRKVRWKPGTRHSYSNPGYAMAGYLIEKVTGQPFDEYLWQNLLDALNMPHSTFTLSDRIRPKLATGYQYQDQKFKQIPLHPIYMRPAGSLISTAEDLSHLVRLFLNKGCFGGRRLIADSSLVRMEHPNTTLASKHGLEYGYGLANYMHQVKGWPMMGHGGGMPGFQADYRYNRKLDRGFVVMMNGNNGMEKIRKALTSFITKRSNPDKKPVVSLDTERMQNYTGYYQHRSPRNEFLKFVTLPLNGVQVSIRKDTLYVQKGLFGSPQKLLPVGNTQFRYPDDARPTVIFLTSDSYGRVLDENGNFLVKSSDWKPLIYKMLIFGLGGVFVLTLLIGIVWGCYALYQRWIRGKDFGTIYIWQILLPPLTLLSLIGASFSVTQIHLYRIGDMGWYSLFFTILTVLFALLSLVTAVFSVHNIWKRQTPAWSRWYGAISSVALVLLAGYLTYWGIIGLRLWTY